MAKQSADGPSREGMPELVAAVRGVEAAIERRGKRVEDVLGRVVRAMEVQNKLLDEVMTSLANEAQERRERAERKRGQERSIGGKVGEVVVLDDDEQPGETEGEELGKRGEEDHPGSLALGATESL